MSRIKQNLALLFAICCVSFAGPLIKVALMLAMPPVAVAFFRLFFSTALLSVPNARQHGFALYKTLSKKEVGLLVASGLCLALHFFCWISSLSIISTFASTVIVCTQPLFVMVGAFLFFREVPSPRALPGVVLCVAGTVIIALAGGMDSGTIWGSVLALLGALFSSCYFLCNKALRHTLPLTPHTFAVYGICAVCLLLLSFFLRSPLLTFPWQGYAICFALAVLCTLGGHSVLNWALKYFKAGVVSVAMLGEPLGAALWAFLLFGEQPGLTVLLGGLVILAGVVWFAVFEQKEPSATDS